MKMERVLLSPLFIDCWDDVTDDERKDVIALINKLDVESVKEWVMTIQWRTPETMSLTQLKRLAQQLSVYNYSRLSKPELVREIKESDKWLS